MGEVSIRRSPVVPMRMESAYTALPNEKLLRRWRDGDAKAANAILGRYVRPLRRFFMAKSRHDVEDLVQQTLLAVVEGCGRLRDDACFGAYVFGVARLKLMAHRRRRGREAMQFGHYGEELVSIARVAELPALSEPRTELDDAMIKLPADFQQVLRMTYWQELTAPEIASKLRVPVATIYSRLLRGKLRLQTLIV